MNGEACRLGKLREQWNISASELVIGDLVNQQQLKRDHGGQSSGSLGLSDAN